jgi:hypothetical protein
MHCQQRSWLIHHIHLASAWRIEPLLSWLFLLKPMIIVRAILGAFFGALGGTAAGFAIACLVGEFGYISHPNDPSAKSGAIIGFLTVPVGCVIGAALGFIYAVTPSRPPNSNDPKHRADRKKQKKLH